MNMSLEQFCVSQDSEPITEAAWSTRTIRQTMERNLAETLGRAEAMQTALKTLPSHFLDMPRSEADRIGLHF